MFDLVAGFVYSQVLAACVQLDLFALLLAAGPLDAEAIGRRTGLAPEAAERLLAAAVALQLLERRGADRYGLGRLGAPLAGNGAVAAMVAHHALFYADLADPLALLRADPDAGAKPTRLAAFWPYAGRAVAQDDAAAAYSALMTASQPLVADEIFAAVRLERHRRLLDIGGGEGTFLLDAARRSPRLELVLFDLPAVAARAAARFTAAGLGERARAVGGSFLDDPLPAGADIATLIRVLHDHDDASVRAILAAARRALPPGGTLVVAEPMAATPGAEAMGDAYFGFYLLAMGRGRPRSAGALTALLHEAGFARVRRVATALPLQTGLLIAEAAG